MSPTWVVHKFGGTSLADADRYRGIVPLLAAESAERCAVVVSAMSGVTDGLLRLAELAAAGSAWEAQLERLAQREQAVTRALLDEPAASELCAGIATDVRDLAGLAGALRLMRSRPRSVVDLVLGYGELWSAQRLAAHLTAQGRETSWLDARQVLIVRPGDPAAVVDWAASQRRLDDWLARNERSCVVITGFVASTADGTPTTLGRNGSDFSASIFAALLEAASITIWTDVDGVMSADPRRVTDARVLPELSYDEAMELAYFGAKVIHPSTMSPAVRAGIPLFIRNTFRPECAGTRIHRDPTARGPVKGFATVENLALVNLEGSGMIGVPGIAERLFGALSQASVSVILISQASSEHSICFAVPNEQADSALAAVEQAFFAERHTGQIQPAQLQRDCAVLAAVGDGMAGQPGLASQLLRGSRSGLRERTRDRAGLLGAQHLGRDRRTRRDALVARGARGLLPLEPDALDRAHRAGARRRHAARPVRPADRSAPRRSARRPARPRASSTARRWCSRTTGSRSTAGAPRPRSRPARRAWRASWTMCRPSPSRTPC